MKIQFPEGNTTLDALEAFDVFLYKDKYYMKLNHPGVLSLHNGNVINFNGCISVTKYSSTLIIGEE